MGTRIKTYDSTGQPTAGRLYAGDLNQIQDDYADLSNFLQTLDVAVVRLGDSGLQLLKYGPGELRFTGAVRLDGILRALGGFYAGAFTTAQRNAIPVGQNPQQRPFGLVILNTDVSELQINLGTDAAPQWVPVGQRVGGLVLPAGTGITFGDATVQTTAAVPPPFRTVAQMATELEVDKKEVYVILDDDETLLPLVFRAAVPGAHKWFHTGGGKRLNLNAGPVAVPNNNAYQSLAAAVSIDFPGIYDVKVEARLAGRQSWLSFAGPGIPASDDNGVREPDDGGTMQRERRIEFNGSGTLTAQGKVDIGQAGTFYNITISAKAVKVSRA
jgi:hypothetical protein